MKSYSVILICVSTILFGCALSFNSKFSELKKGTIKQKVTNILGEPDFKEEAVMIGGMFWGPQEILSPVLEVGAIYHEWRYEKDGQVYYIWFSGGKSDLKKTWGVIAKSSYPKGAVFESNQ